MPETATLTLSDFLLVRIAEDEEQLGTARRMGVPTLGGSRMWSGIGNHPTVSEERLAAECEAKRRIVGLEGCYACSDAWTPCEHREMTLRLLALPYADHPAYREEWRP